MKFRKNRTGPGIEILEALPNDQWKRTVSPSPCIADAMRVAGVEPEPTPSTPKPVTPEDECDKFPDLWELIS